MNMELLEQMVTEGYVAKKTYGDFALYNYNQECQFKKVWNEATLNARGLIINEKTGKIHARPFPKFFNWEELEGLGIEVPKGKFTYTEKMDGSLGILWSNGLTWDFATRGSFDSDQAKTAYEIFMEDYDEYKYNLIHNYTYLFEIIYPENRIVVDYGKERKLVLLGVIDNETGDEMDDEFERLKEFFPSVTRHEKAVSFESLKAQDKANEEGYVIRFENGFRMKIKFEDYCRLHRIMTGFNERTVWEMLKDETDFESVLINVPEEFLEWIEEVKIKFIGLYDAIESRAIKVYNGLYRYETRKEQAIYIVQEDKEVSAIVFKMIDGKDYSEIIWKMIRPKGETDGAN